MNDRVTFDRFLEAVRGTNPFRSTRVTDPARSDGDVRSINEDAFKRLTRGVERLGKDSTPTGMLLLGAAGVGKSHLLARLFQWAEEDHATVIYLHNLLASPERMFRYVLNATVSSLASHHGAYAESRLYQVLTRALINEGSKARDASSRRAAMLRVVASVDPSGNVGPVLAAFREAADPSVAQPDADHKAMTAVRWLSGEVVDADEAPWIGKSAPEEGLSLPDDAAADHVLQVLARICARAKRPLVLCLDQVDNLDPSGVTAVASLAHALIDRGQHLMVIVSGVKETLLRLKREGIIPEAAWDRIAEHTVELMRVSPDEAVAIVQRRLEPMIRVFHGVPEVARARESDPLFPIGTPWFREKLGDVPEFRPRDIVTWARDRWEQQQALLESRGGAQWIADWQAAKSPPAPAVNVAALIDEEVKRKLAEGVNRRKLEPASLPPDEDNLATLTYNLLARCVGDSRGTLVDLSRPKPVKKAVTHHLLAKERRSDGIAVTTGITFITAASGHGPRWALTRILDDKNPPDHVLLVTDEERRPLRLGKAGQEQYEKLKKRGKGQFEHVKLSFESYAELDAMVGLLGDAKGGDLEIEHPKGTPRAVSENEAVESLHRNGKFLAHLLLHELLTEEVGTIRPEPKPGNHYNEERAKQHIMAELSWRLGLMAKELTQTFIARERLSKQPFDVLWARIKTTAQSLHAEGNVFAHAQDDDLFLQFRKKPA